MANKVEFFEFNLLQDKSRKELQQEEKRDESIFYTVVLLFSGVIIFLLLHLLDLLLVESRIVEANNTIADFEQAIEAKDDVRAKNGELFVKSERLAPVLEEDIKLIDFLQIADNIVGGDIEIISYVRDQNGSFNIDFYVSNHSEALDVLSQAQNQNNVEQPFIRSLTVDEDRIEDLKVSLEFNITLPLEEDAA